MGYPIHFHELESSLGGIYEKIMSEELLDWSQSKIFLVTNVYLSPIQIQARTPINL